MPRVERGTILEFDPISMDGVVQVGELICRFYWRDRRRVVRPAEKRRPRFVSDIGRSSINFWKHNTPFHRQAVYGLRPRMLSMPEVDQEIVVVLRHYSILVKYWAYASNWDAVNTRGYQP